VYEIRVQLPEMLMSAVDGLISGAERATCAYICNAARDMGLETRNWLRKAPPAGKCNSTVPTCYAFVRTMILFRWLCYIAALDIHSFVDSLLRHALRLTPLSASDNNSKPFVRSSRQRKSPGTMSQSATKQTPSLDHRWPTPITLYTLAHDRPHGQGNTTTPLIRYAVVTAL
jgi:hypothetical protein